MQGTKSPTFRPTVWPAEPPELPPVLRYRLDPVLGVTGLQVAQVLGNFVFPPDFVFRELLERVPSPTDDVRELAQDVISLTADWGLAGLPGRRAFDGLYGAPPPGVESELEEWEQTPRLVPLVHPVAIEAHLGVLRVLSRHLLAYLEGAGDAAIIAAWSEPWGGGPVGSVAEAGWRWEGYVNRGLAPFTVHVRWDPSVSTSARLTRPVPNLFNVCCLQLARYLAGDAPVLRCANERCGRPFTRQRGRARDDYGQHRSRGVRYCSHLCAKAQSERDRRRRRALGEGKPS